VVKLNPEKEGSDAGALALGMTVQRFPISFEQQMVGNGIETIVTKAAAAIGPNTLVHCSHGQDRTGVTVALYRINSGWTKSNAEIEMKNLGFHEELVGLWGYWCEDVK
jgi:hypothetical protein